MRLNPAEQGWPVKLTVRDQYVGLARPGCHAGWVVRPMSATRRPRAGRGLLANSIALLAKTHISALLGFLFWTVCARGVSASTIGLVSTALSAMALAAMLAAGGFEPFLARVLSRCEP